MFVSISKKTWSYIRTYLCFGMMAAVIGIVCGLAGGAFSLCLGFATQTFKNIRWLLYLLPVGGVVIAAIYKLFKLPAGIGTNFIFDTVRSQEKVPVLLFPAIFVSTFITHILGGSAGREGAALQIGGSLGALIGRAVPNKNDRRRIFELCGMAAAFSALFGTPLAAAVFVIGVIDIGKVNYRALMPVVISSVGAYLIAQLIGAEAEAFPLAEKLMQVNALTLAKALGMGAACAVIAIIFCFTIEHSHELLAKLIKNEFLRVIVGAIVIIGATLLIGTYDYNGGSMGLILSALSGETKGYDFILKLLFTAVTLGAGFKGGEIVPSFCVGATFGCAFAPIVGFDPALGAAVGMLCVFCGATNAPIATMLLAVEIFGTEYLPIFAVAIVTSYMLSSNISLYASQKIAEPKLGE